MTTFSSTDLHSALLEALRPRPRLLSSRLAPSRAAVAAIVRVHDQQPEILFIHRAEHPLDPWSGHMAFPGGRMQTGDASEQAMEDLVRVAAGLLPGVEPRPAAVEQCLYTTTPNEDFVIERDGPIVVVSPCSGHGFKFGPAIGRMVAEFALGQSEPLDRFRLR